MRNNYESKSKKNNIKSYFNEKVFNLKNHDIESDSIIDENKLNNQ